MDATTAGGRPFLLVPVVCLGLLAGACSSDDGSDDASDDRSEREVTTTTAPAGPVADLSEELGGGDGVFIGSPGAVGADGSYSYEFDEPGYVEEEFVAAGAATAFAPEGELASDGGWTLAEGDTADYRTRVLVRRPESPDDFSGVVVVEWFNVSGGADADPEWTSVSDEILRQGHAWVGVSAQSIGVEGGPVRIALDVPGSEAAGQGLKAIDPERYRSLAHPGDAFGFDMFTQIARAVRAGEALGGLEPTTLVAAGESQSAGALVTYYNGFQPSTSAFDGFFVHSRGASGLPIPAPGESVDIVSTIGRTPTIFRADVDAPVVDLQAEGDVAGFLSSLEARQDDSDTFRLWELAGSPHADVHLVGENTVALADCGIEVNDGPMHIVAKAGLRSLIRWVEDGEPPAEAPRLEVVEGDEPGIQRDRDGIAVGGIRPPPVGVPVRVLSSEPGPSREPICLILGSSTPLSAERLGELYSSRADYEERYAAAVDAAIETGYVLEDDRAAIEAYRDPAAIPG
jgi:hypothetical protein